MPGGVENVAAGIVEGKREAERPAFADLGDSLQHFLWRNQIEASGLVIGAELAPVRSGRPVTPAHARSIPQLTRFLPL